MVNINVKYVVIIMIWLVVNRGGPACAAITCGSVLTTISPCISYVQRGGAVPTSCCDGVKSLNDKTRTTPDLQAACTCLKSLIPSVGANAALVNSLPAKCHVDFPYQYSPSLDCSKLTR
ncbi:hypothetical protein ABFS83_10G004300 [Erythranthe nasuta]